MTTDATTPFLAAVALALIGYVGTYVYSRALQRRKDQLDRVNSQLKDLYGPLLALVSSSDLLFGRWRETEFRLIGGWAQATEKDKEQWRLWMVAAFMPMNRQMKDLITTHAHLIDEDYMPPALLTLCAHVAAYEVLLRKWDGGDYERMVPYIIFPEVVGEYVATSFERLKETQDRLMFGKSRKKQSGIRTLDAFRRAYPKYFVDRQA